MTSHEKYPELAPDGRSWKEFRAEREEWRKFLRREPCVYCGRAPREIKAIGKKYREGHATPMAVDHILAKEHGGRSGWENEAPACWSCNNSRGTQPFLFFMICRRQAVQYYRNFCYWRILVQELRYRHVWRHGMRASWFGIDLRRPSRSQPTTRSVGAERLGVVESDAAGEPVLGQVS